jgi:glycosyltransferase involved in cell wall biosynthesis
MNSLPKVILAAPTWSLNGPNVFSARLARGLNQAPPRGSAHVLLTRPDWVDRKPLPLPSDVPFATLPVDQFASLRTRWRTLLQYLEAQAPCVYVPNHDVWHSCVSPKLSKNVAIVGIVHSDDPQHYDHVLRLGRYWNAIVAVSQGIAEQIVKLDASLEPRLSVIPYGVDTPAQVPPRASAAELRLIYAGRLDQNQKRVLDLPKIVHAALNAGVPVRLSVAGAGEAEAALKASCHELAVGDHVTFLGTLGDAALADAMAAHDVFLLPSAFEGLPISLLEAMAQGCVPIATDIRSGARQLITQEENGFLVPMGDIAAFTKRLAHLHQDPQRRTAMSERAHATIVTEGYRTGDMVARYAALFEAVLRDAKSGVFLRPAGKIVAPREIPWPEYLPGALQQFGHRTKRLFGHNQPAENGDPAP